MFGKKIQTEDQLNFAGTNQTVSDVNKQASLLAATSHTAEVAELK